MGYKALARKWRPKAFSEVIGQPETVKALANALDTERLHHAYLFSGCRGIGKTTLARIFAKSLNCSNGISSKPCGTCASCLEIDEGRMIDLIEVDAASRTKVEETRQLLDNVQYAPTRSRFKIYLIDEIHMFSKHSFNALLKTLEEPPAHAKFLLATTDPEKIPVTVLSRCLRFGLRKVGLDVIVHQLERVLDSEKVTFEKPALIEIARSSDGSVRDALSLLEQAIVHGNGRISFENTGKMLGLAQLETVVKILELVSEGNGAKLLEVSRELGMRTSSFDRILKQMLDVLRRVAVVQVIGITEADGLEDDKNLIDFSEKISSEDCQLYYEIALQGLKNLEVTSDYESAFEMILLRLLAFTPSEKSTDNLLAGFSEAGQVNGERQVLKNSQGPPEEEKSRTDKQSNNDQLNGENENLNAEWGDLVQKLELTGLPRELARNSILCHRKGPVFFLGVSESFSGFIQRDYVESIATAISRQLESKVEVKINVLDTTSLKTPVSVEREAIEMKKVKVEDQLKENPNIKKLQSVFDANLDELSLKK